MQKMYVFHLIENNCICMKPFVGKVPALSYYNFDATLSYGLPWIWVHAQAPVKIEEIACIWRCKVYIAPGDLSRQVL